MLISQNPYSSDIFRPAFSYNGTMLETGYPRNDILFKAKDGLFAKNMKEKLSLPEYKKVILYAPTWRDDMINGAGIYKFETSLDFDMLRDRLSDEYVIAVKYHYLVKDQIDWSHYEGFVYVFDESEDIAGLMAVADILVTDYSSVMFDYPITGRPMYFFCPDIERYKNVLRGFYFDFEQTAPGPIVYTTDELAKQIKAGTSVYEKTYGERYDAFVKLYIPWDDGNASERVIEAVL